MKWFLISLFLIAIMATPTFSGVPLSHLGLGQFVGPQLEILRSSRKLTIQEVIERKDFKKATQEIPRFGYTHDDIWARLEIRNDFPQAEEIFFELRGPIETVTAFFVKDNKVIETSKAGMFFLPRD